MDEIEISSVQKYLRRKFANDKISLKDRAQTDGSVEVSVDGEHIGVIYRAEEDDETSYAFHMAILEFDLTEGEEKED